MQSLSTTENLAILTWNIGEDAEKKLSIYTKDLEKIFSYKDSYSNEFSPIHLIICLQECNNYQKFNKLNINGYTKQKDTINIRSGLFGIIPNNFALNILYFVRNSDAKKYEIHCEPNWIGQCSSKSLSFFNTKYIQPVYVTDSNKNILFYIFNIHSVFDNIKKVNKSYKTIVDYVNKFTKNTRDTPVFIVGDFNTRSLDLEGNPPQCYKKNVELCTMDNNKTYCYFDNMDVNNIFNKLKTFENITTRSYKFGRIYPDKLIDEKCLSRGGGFSYNDPFNYPYYLHNIQPSQNNKQLPENNTQPSQNNTQLPENNTELINNIKTLIKTDYLNYLIYNNIIFEDYQEITPFFPPTYKIDPSTQIYSQKKGKEKGRLTGFPDRIIYESDDVLNCLYYNSLPWIGNDHLPVLGIFSLPNNNYYGGFAVGNRKSNKRKSNKRKSNKRKSNKRKSNKRKSNKRKLNNRKLNNRK